MEYGAIDLHKKESQIRIVTTQGQVIDRRIPTTREAFTAVFAEHARMRVLLESSTESEWVARHVESLGHEVIVADPNYAPMYGQRSRRIKTDRRDVAALSEACQLGIYRAVHRRAARHWAIQRDLQVRDYLLQTRTGAISLARALTRAEGGRVRSGDADDFLRRLAAVAMPPALYATLAPVRQLIETCTAEIRRLDDQVAARAERDPVVRRLMTAPGVGPLTASGFVAAVDDVTRFQRAAQVTNYLGLVPREYSSGERQHRGHVVRSAHPRLQAHLVQAAWSVWRSRRVDTADLRRWAQAIARRRGTNVAIIALARRLARILFAMWRDAADYRAGRDQSGPCAGLTTPARAAVG
jgi:transposase